ncbi:periplasmic binding protein [Catenulispora acidiphila DSM 44928]|uniref:Periplasmic binding protein n=1 Tax=Catenulispora acidiphila (strain DSM 44928 / JCM 14897 / NBRC 102108 / NRRL B-24433 / ID139908) TaxID=479433 RepID=C7Q3R0_CATAD|nr:ABC transporter substrate-binding protein [Catenulispora acidiphila]ACU77668.1 periplasmic binding protein [Catenulispora acidiphila DSM 44928]
MHSRPHSLTRRVAVGVVAVSALLAAGCSSSKSAPAPAAATSSTSPAAAAFPTTVTAKNGAVKLAAEPKKIVSLSPSATEDLFQIGAGSQVVAVDDQSNFPASAPKTSLSGYKPNAEAIAKYNPDLVVVADDSAQIVEQLGKLNVPVLWFDAPNTLDDAYSQITALGTATGHTAAATTEVSSMKQQITAAIAATKKPATPLKYYYEVGTPGNYSATSKTFIGSILSQFGLTNIADPADKTGGGYPQLSDEYLVTAAPDLIFLADTKCCQQTPATTTARPGWSAIPAVKNAPAKHTIVGLDDDIASRWGPRLVGLVQQISQAVNQAQD